MAKKKKNAKKIDMIKSGGVKPKKKTHPKKDYQAKARN
jgi:hypothetical protein